MVSGVESTVVGTAEPGIGRDIEALARYFVESGQVVPGITVGESNRARSWWWPLPAARDRGAIAAGLPQRLGGSPASGGRATRYLG